MKEKQNFYWIKSAGLLPLAALLLFDQWTKHLAVLHLKGKEPFVLMKGVFELSYLENKGAAFGMLKDRLVIFFIITAVVMAAVLFMYMRLPLKKRYLPLHLVGIGIMAGAAGNLTDRIQNGYVVDFFYFRLIDFPVFNMADIYVVLSSIFLVLYVMFFYQEEELERIIKKKPNKQGGESGT